MKTAPGNELEFTPIEQEVIALDIAINNINTSVNNELLQFRHGKNGTEVIFPTNIHQKYFYVIVLDFLSKNSDKKLIGKKVSILDLLQKIADKPSFKGLVGPLKQNVFIFNDWLSKPINRRIFLPENSVDIELTREEVIMVTANITKHHFGHLTAVIRKIREANSKMIDDYEIIQGLQEIYFDLHENVLNYHGSIIAQHLNNIRLGIYDYLLPEFKKSFTRIDENYYRYRYPKGLKSEIGMACYWELMEFVRAKPYVNKFEVHKFLKMRY